MRMGCSFACLSAECSVIESKSKVELQLWIIFTENGIYPPRPNRTSLVYVEQRHSTTTVSVDLFIELFLISYTRLFYRVGYDV